MRFAMIDITSASEMTYIVSGGALNSLTHSASDQRIGWLRPCCWE